MTPNERTEEFIDLYKQLEVAIETSYEGCPQDIGRAVSWLLSDKSAPKLEYGLAKRLKMCKNVRDALSHIPQKNGEYPVVPSEAMLQVLRDVLEQVERPPRARDYCVLTQDVFSVSMQDKIRPAMKRMVERSFTYVPVLEDDRVAGVFSENTLLSYVSSDTVVGIDTDDTFSALEALLPLGKHDSEMFGFVAMDDPISTVVDLFLKAMERGERLGMLFVTANGREGEKLLGILTAWDMAKFF